MNENQLIDSEVTRFARLFDHSIVRPDATREQVRQFAHTAARLGTASLSVQPHYIGFAVELLRGSGVLVGTVVGFPHGNETPSMKERQAEEVLDLGAEEIDMVMNIPALKNGERICSSAMSKELFESLRGSRSKSSPRIVT